MAIVRAPQIKQLVLNANCWKKVNHEIATPPQHGKMLKKLCFSPHKKSCDKQYQNYSPNSNSVIPLTLIITIYLYVRALINSSAGPNHIPARSIFFQNSKTKRQKQEKIIVNQWIKTCAPSETIREQIFNAHFLWDNQTGQIVFSHRYRWPPPSPTTINIIINFTKKKKKLWLNFDSRGW